MEFIICLIFLLTIFFGIYFVRKIDILQDQIKKQVDRIDNIRYDVLYLMDNEDK